MTARSAELPDERCPIAEPRATTSATTGDPETGSPGAEADDWAPVVPVLGMHIHEVDLDGAVAAIFRAIDGGRRGYVVTPNAQHVVLFRRDPVFRASCEGAALRLADGMSLVWASRFFGRPLPARVAGSDLLPEVCRVAATRGASVFLCGGRAGVAQRAAESLKRRYPGLRIAGTFTPAERFHWAGEATDDAVRAVNGARPDVLFVGLGAPVQEAWVHEHWDRLQVPVAVCCGAALDYAAGTRRRAPGWMRRAGLEWFWRLAGEPRRLWRRYLVLNVVFLGICFTEWCRVRFRPGGR